MIFFVECEMYGIVSERKHVNVTLKTYKQINAHEHETRTRVNN